MTTSHAREIFDARDYERAQAIATIIIAEQLEQIAAELEIARENKSGEFERQHLSRIWNTGAEQYNYK